MSWSIGYDPKWHRDIGYAVPAYCDHSGCNETIDRGLAFVCGGEPYGGERGCGLYFCKKHLVISKKLPQVCNRCRARHSPFKPKQDHPEWLVFKLTDPSWQPWRSEQPKAVLQGMEQAAKVTA